MPESDDTGGRGGRDRRDRKRDDGGRRDRPGRDIRRDKDPRDPEDPRGGRPGREAKDLPKQFAAWVETFQEFLEGITSIRTKGLAAADEAGLHSDRASAAAARAATLEPTSGDVAAQIRAAKAASKEAAKHRAAAEDGFGKLKRRVAAVRSAHERFVAAMDKRDEKAAQEALGAVDPLVDAAADAIEPILASEAAAKQAAAQAEAAADAAEKAAKKKPDEVDPNDDPYRKQFEHWAKTLQRAAETLNASRVRARQGTKAAREHAARAAEHAARAQGVEPMDEAVEGQAQAAADAASRAAEASAQAEALLTKVDAARDAFDEARKRFEQAAENVDEERGHAAISDAESLSGDVESLTKEIETAVTEAEAAAKKAEEAADRAVSAGEDAEEEASQADDETRRAVEQAEETAAELEGWFGDLDDPSDGALEAADAIDQLIAKGVRCTERASRSPVHGPVARKALEEAKEHFDAATAARRRLAEARQELRTLVKTARESADKAVEIAKQDLRDPTIAELIESIAEVTEAAKGLVDEIQGLIATIGELDALVEAAVERACEQARLARPDRTPGVLIPSQPRPVPSVETPEPEETEPTGPVPLLLMPIRIETRFAAPSDDITPLRIRIYPDQITVVDDRTILTPAEVEVAKEFWERHHAASSDEARDATWMWFVDQVDIHRAGHLARQVRPEVRNGDLRFPEVETTEVDVPGRVTCLPNRFIAVGWSGDTEVFRVPGEKLDEKPYHTSPDPTADVAATTDAGITTTEHMRWMVDYDNAVERGMAITVDTDPGWGTIDTLMVLGVMETDVEASTAALTELFDTHATGQGFAFVPQGTPTNNTDTVDAGWTRVQRERSVVAEQRRRELAEKPEAAAETNVDRFSRALGLDRAFLARQPFAHDDEWQRSAAMRAALHDLLIGRYLKDLLPTGNHLVLGDDAHADLRTWCRDHLTGGAALPTFRIGPQPYGILPVLRPGHDDLPPTIGRRVNRVVRRLKDEWLRSLSDGVPRLDHRAGEDPDVVSGNIADVLASEPHIADLFVRRLDLHIDTGGMFDGYLAGLLFNFQDGVLETSGDVTWVDIDNGFVREFELDRDTIETDAPELWSELVAMRLELGAPQTVEDQIIIWSKFRDFVVAVTRNPWGEAAEANVWIRQRLRAATDILSTVEDVLAGLVAHEQRQRPLANLRIPNFNGVLGEDNPTLIVSKFRPEASPVERPLVVADGYDPVEYIASALSGDGIGDATQAPLLAQVLAAAVTQQKLPPDEMRRAIDVLTEASVEELEWSLRETLGLGVHRLDAWHTAWANQELAKVRTERPEGVRVGSYAWVSDLEIPKEAIARASRGFLHAPSLAQAATASVVRSAWAARGTADGLSPAAVDLRSNRYRYASWLIEGVRAGQPLGDLLGYEFERLCHDLQIDEQIARVRLVVADAQQRSGGLEDPVDGLELVELFRAGGLDAHIAAVEAESGDERAELVRFLLEGLERSFDAVDDALLAESTHFLLAGNTERATAAIESGAGGSAPPPTPIAADTPRRVRTINHKVVLLADAAGGSTGWPSGLRDQMAPAFEQLAASLLPAPADVSMVLVEGDTVDVRSLDELPLSALDVVYLGSDDPTTVDAALAEVVRLAFGTTAVVNPSVQAGAQPVTFEEFQIAALAVRRLLSQCRPATDEDLNPGLIGAADESAAAVDPSDVLSALDGEFDGAVDDAMRLRLAVSGIVARPDAADRQRADADAVAVAVRRLETALALEAPSGFDVISTFFARPFPIGTPLATTLSAVDASLAAPNEVFDWLDTVSLVRPDVSQMVMAANLGALIGADGRLGAGSMQSPRHSNDGWAAIAAPEPGTGGRNIVTTVWAGGATSPPAEAVGLVIDQWSEQLPEDSTITGVAMHYDAPSQRPPQALLLGVPETDHRWNLDAAIGLVFDSIEWMQLRAVAPEDLGDFGHTLPTVFSSESLYTEALAVTEER